MLPPFVFPLFNKNLVHDSIYNLGINATGEKGGPNVVSHQ